MIGLNAGTGFSVGHKRTVVVMRRGISLSWCEEVRTRTVADCEDRLNHACEATPLTERVNDAPRVSSSSTPAIGAPPASSTPAADAPLALSTPASDAPVAATFGSPTHDPATPMPLPNIEEPLPSSSTNEAQQELAAAYAIASITGGGEMQGDEEPTEVRG